HQERHVVEAMLAQPREARWIAHANQVSLRGVVDHRRIQLLQRLFTPHDDARIAAKLRRQQLRQIAEEHKDDVWLVATELRTHELVRDLRTEPPPPRDQSAPAHLDPMAPQGVDESTGAPGPRHALAEEEHAPNGTQSRD